MTEKLNQCAGCGDCCEMFYLPHSKKELLRMYRRWANGTVVAGEKTNKPFNDIHLIYPMVILIGQKSASPNNYMYTCKNFDTKARRCTIHSIKPKMCRDFPFYGREKPVHKIEDYPRCAYLKTLMRGGKKKTKCLTLQK